MNMKYVITESQKKQVIINYLNQLFPSDELNSTHPYYYNTETGEGGDNENVVEFYLGDYDEGDSLVFRWYDCEHFNENSPASKKCPIIDMEPEYLRILNGYFGDMWIEPFKEWFNSKPTYYLPIKTIE